MKSIVPVDPKLKEAFDKGYTSGFYGGYTSCQKGVDSPTGYSECYGKPSPSQDPVPASVSVAAAPEKSSYDGLLVVLLILCLMWAAYNRIHGNRQASSVPPQEQRYFVESGLCGVQEVDEAGYPKHGGLLHFMPKDIREAAENGDGMAVVRYDAALLRGLDRDLAVKEALAPSPKLRELRQEVNYAAPPIVPGR
jgi:hypothetical protein